MMSRDYQGIFVRDFNSRQREFCALVVSLLLLFFCLVQDGSLVAGRSSVGGFSFSYAIVATALAIGLAAACACELSHSQAVAGSVMRALPAANRPGPNIRGKTLLGRQLNCQSNVGKTGSTPVWGNGQTRCVHPLRSCEFTAWTSSINNSRSR
jgi:hypothetical protein